MIALSVNLNKIALLRNARGAAARPELLDFARLAMEAGASGLTVHPRPDQRHIRIDDVPALLPGFGTAIRAPNSTLKATPSPPRGTAAIRASRPS